MVVGFVKTNNVSNTFVQYLCSKSMNTFTCLYTEGSDFTSTLVTVTIPAGATTTTVRVPVISDNIVEGDEMFSMSLTVPPSLGPGIVAGSVTSATGIIVDSTGKS